MTPHETEVHDTLILSLRAALFMGREGAPDHLVSNCFRSAYTAARYNLPDWVVNKMQAIDFGDRDLPLDELEDRFLELMNDQSAGSA